MQTSHEVWLSGVRLAKCHLCDWHTMLLQKHAREKTSDETAWDNQIENCYLAALLGGLTTSICAVVEALDPGLTLSIYEL